MRYTFSILFFFLVSTQLFAQYPSTTYTKSEYKSFNLENLSLGLRLSPSITWLDIDHDDAVADGASLKFNVGLVADYELTKNLSIISGLNYNNGGGYVFDNQSLNDMSTKDNYKINYTSIEIPLGLRLQTNNTSNTDYYIQGGVSANLLISAEEKFKSTSPNIEIQPSNIISLTNPYVLGSLGNKGATGYFGTIGIEFTVAKVLGLFIEISYKNSIESIADGNSYINLNSTDPLYHGYTKPIDIRLGSMDFSFGIMF